MKTNKLIILLTAIALVFIWGCEKDTFTAIDQKIDSRAKGGIPGPPDDGGGDGDLENLYKIEYTGTYFNSITYGTKGKSTKKSDSMDQSHCGGFEMGHGNGLFCVPDNLFVCAMGNYVGLRRGTDYSQVDAVVEYWDGDPHSLWNVLILRNKNYNGFNLFPENVAPEEGSSITIDFTTWYFRGSGDPCNAEESGEFNEENPQQVIITNLGVIGCPEPNSVDWPDGCDWPDP